MSTRSSFIHPNDIRGASDHDRPRPEILSYLFFAGLIATTFLF